jgi:60S ribosomal subunit assembly/export protein LOC1
LKISGKKFQSFRITREIPHLTQRKPKMAPIKSNKGPKPSMGKGVTKSTSKPSPKTSSTAKKTPFKKPKTQATAHVKKKKRVYTEKELGIPTLNMITPAGVQKVRGKKKGKVFVDDQESMMTILAIVNAEKEGQIESKMIKAVCPLLVVIEGATSN